MAFNNSGIEANLHLAHAAEVTFNEEGYKYSQILKFMQNSSDGVMDNIKQLRNQYLADIMVLIDVLQTPKGVIGSVMKNAIPATANMAFAALDYEYIGFVPGNSGYTFAHEVGHLFGMRHAINQDPRTNPFSYGHGYIQPNYYWRTIVTHPPASNLYTPVIPYYSNPNVDFSGFKNLQGVGDPVGEEGVANNTRVINFTKYTLRNFRALSPPSNFTLTNRYHIGETPHFTWTKNPNAENYGIYRCITTDLGGFNSPC